jgi:hypothetical protein
MHAAACPHTACQLGRARIIYRFHPFANKDVTVLRRTRYGGDPAVLVRVEHDDKNSDDPELRVVVPCWMLDQAACSAVVVRDTPRINIDALNHLRQLVDQFAKTSGQENGDSVPMTAKGDRHETRNRKPTQAARPHAASETTDV